MIIVREIYKEYRVSYRVNEWMAKDGRAGGPFRGRLLGIDKSRQLAYGGVAFFAFRRIIFKVEHASEKIITKPGDPSIRPSAV